MAESVTQQQLQYPPEYNQINFLLDEYKRVIEEKFQSNEYLLLQQLESKTHQLKHDIATYKTKISQQNLEKLITNKRHQKETQRLQLEVQWRNLTEKYKKLQQDEKKINEENRQNQFDIQNLQRKILQLQQSNKLMELKLQHLKQSANHQPFITQIKTDYVSPYKCPHKIINQAPQLKNMKVKSTANFRLKLQNIKKYRTTLVPQNKQNQFSTDHIPTKLPSFAQELDEKKAQFLKKNQSKFSPFELNSLYSYQDQNKQNDKPNKSSISKGQKWAELTYYLNKPQVRDKIFDLLRKQTLSL